MELLVLLFLLVGFAALVLRLASRADVTWPLAPALFADLDESDMRTLASGGSVRLIVKGQPIIISPPKR